MKGCRRGVEEGFGAHDVDTALGINKLGDVDVAGNGDQGVGIVAGDVGVVRILLGQEGDHVADSHLSGGLEIQVESHCDVLSRSFSTGPDKTVRIVEIAFVDDELEGAGELGFEGRDVDFAVALTGVTVADFKVRAFGIDGEIDGSAGDELLVVHVAAVHPRRSGVVLASRSSGDPHAAEEWMKRNVDAGREVADHLCTVEWDDTGVAVREVVGEKTAAGAEGVAGPSDVDIDFLDADFEHIAWFGSIDGYGAGEDVASGTLVGCRIVFVDVVNVGGDVGGSDAERFQALARAAGGEGLDLDRVSGFDGQDRFCLCGVEAPGDRGRGGEEGLGGLLGVGCGDDEKCSDAEGGCAGELGAHGLYISQWCIRKA